MMKKMFHKILALSIVIIQLLSLMSIVSFAEADNEDTQIKNIEAKENNIINDTILGEVDLETKKEFKLNLSTEKTIVNQPIKIDFDKKDVVDYYYEAEGITVIKANSDTTKIEFTATDEFGYLDVYVDYGNGELIKSSVYTYKYNDTVYVSELGKDMALHNCMEELYNLGKITKGEWEDKYYELCQSVVKELPSQNVVAVQNDNTATTSSNSIVVSGELSWVYPEFNLLPLRYTEVELRKKLLIGSTKIDSGYTDNNGQFSFTVENVNNELDLFVRVSATSNTLAIMEDIVGDIYYIDFPIKQDVVPGSSVGYDYYVDYDETFVAERAVSVLQGMVVGQRFANQMGMNTDEIICVIYPSKYIAESNNAFCYGITIEEMEYYLDNNEVDGEGFLRLFVKILGITDIGPKIYVSEIGSELFDDFDTLIHEYGHFVEHIMGNYGSDLEEIVKNWPEHQMRNDNFAEDEEGKQKEKEYAMELTWSESWANAFSHVAQDYYVTEYSEISGFADKMDAIYNIELFESDYRSCEAQEYAVTALLWDLYDNSGTTESHDNISSTYQQWWNYTTKAGTYTLTDFVNVIDEYYPTIRGEVGEIMAAHQISPGNLVIINMSNIEYHRLPPRLVWDINGSQNNPNNMFDVAFYDKYDNFICSTPTFTVNQNYNTKYSYIVPNDIWNEVINAYGGTFTINAVVRSYRSDTPISGPYPSKYCPITLTNSYDVNISASDRLTEHAIKLDKGAYCDFNVTFATGGLKLIQTFGDKDTVIEIYSADGTLLKGRSDTDDKGYSLNALIDYEVEANVEYKIRVKFYSVGVYGKTRLTIMPCKGDLENGVLNFTQYEDLTNINNYTGFLFTTYLEEKGYVEAVTFTPTQSGNYRFEIQSDYDTYIYVIDPRSSEVTVVNYDRNDDSGEGLNPLLVIYLEPYVPYLVVYSMYNPNSIDSRKNLVLIVDRETA